MKGLILIALTFLPAAAGAQAYPDNPAPQAPSATEPASPAPLPDAEWRRVQRIVHGQPILVSSTYGPPLHCRFAGATDAYLFCDSPGSPDGSGYRIERATVLAVEPEMVRPPRREGHPIYIGCIVGAGFAFGISAARDKSGSDAVGVGVVAASMVALVGAPLALDPPNYFRSAPPSPGFRVGVSFPLSRFHWLRPIQR